MPRGARLDAPGTLHHVMVRGIEKGKIVDDDDDRKNFVRRIGEVALIRGHLFLHGRSWTTTLMFCLKAGCRGDELPEEQLAGPGICFEMVWR